MEERDAFIEWLQNKIDTVWDGETPDHYKEALRTGDPNSLGLLIHEWFDFRDSLTSLQEEATEELEQEQINHDAQGFVYLIRNQDIYKIGITQNLLRRMEQLKPDEVVNTVKCRNYKELEKDLHDTFKDSRIPQTEYFRLTSTQVSAVQTLMNANAIQS